MIETFVLCFIVGFLLCYLLFGNNGDLSVGALRDAIVDDILNATERGVNVDVEVETFADVDSQCRGALADEDDEDDDLYLSVDTLRERTNVVARQLPLRESMSEAWVFALDYDDAQQHNALSVLAHARAIRSWSFVDRPIVVLVNEKMRLSSVREQFANENILVHPVSPIVFNKKRLYVLKNVNRLYVWSLTQYEKVVFIANEVALLKNLEYLFEYRAPTFTPNVETPSQMRTAIFVARPDLQTFSAMKEHLRTYAPTFDTSDQAFFDQFFDSQYALLPWNVCPSVRALYLRKELWDFRDIECLHWSQFKPWQWQQRNDLRHLTAHWYSVGDLLRMYITAHDHNRYDYMRRHVDYVVDEHDDAFASLRAKANRTNQAAADLKLPIDERVQ